jgi:deoxyadenosine/deoxycytidine kinase
LTQKADSNNVNQNYENKSDFLKARFKSTNAKLKNSQDPNQSIYSNVNLHNDNNFIKNNNSPSKNDQTKNL